MNNKVSIPQGTRDFPAVVVRKREHIFSTIRKTFELYGFEPLETPAFENMETLMGKYGEEGDKLIFRILNNGLDNERNSGKARAAFEKVLEGKNSTDLTERALKYDLTIPFARYVAMNHTKLGFPFKRYQMQPVWRADRPQKGRYREFWQCDADVVGSTSLFNELDLVNIYHEVFCKLGLNRYELRINHRKILTALAGICGGEERMTDIAVAIDKLDKIGSEKVGLELLQRGLNKEQVAIIEKYLAVSGSNTEKLKNLRDLIGGSANGVSGIEDLEFLLKHTPTINLVIDLTLARGLNYYTGTILEVRAPAEINMGSVGGGGRYDDLTGLFGVPGIPGVGISFGVDRIFDVMEEMGLFPDDLTVSTKLLFFNMGEKESLLAFEIMQDLRAKGVACELFHQQQKLEKQFKYAENRQIPYVAILGTREMQEGYCQIKKLSDGKQEMVSFENLPHYFNNR